MSTRCGYCAAPATQEVRDEYYAPTDDMAWMPVCDRCPKLDAWQNCTLRPLEGGVTMTCCNTRYANVMETLEHTCPESPISTHPHPLL